MTTYQTAANILVALTRETSIGVNATVTGATTVRLIDSPGLEYKRGPLQSAEKLASALKAMGRLGAATVEGSYNSEITAGGHIDLLNESLMRSAWVTTAVIGFATMTTVALGTNTVTAAGGDWIATQGLRVGDIFTITGTTTTANNSLRVPIIAIGTLTLTVPAGTFVTLAATATGTLTRLRKLTNGTTPTRYSYTVEQYDADTDLSEKFYGCRLIGANFDFKPNAIPTVQYSFLGLGRTILTTGTSPYFTSPSATTGQPMMATDASIYSNGAAVATWTGLTLNFAIEAQPENVIGSVYGVDVFDNDFGVTGTITALRSDFAALTAFDAETEFDIGVLLTEPVASGAKPCMGMYLSRVKIGGLVAPVGGSNGAKVETRTLMFGARVAATGYDATVASFATSV
jgi:hypothetical protein